MLYESDQDNRFLMHHGVPGQRWGVITKEYQKVGYDHRYDHTQFKNGQAQAVLNMKRRRQAQRYQEEQYRRRAAVFGRRVGDNFFWQARHNEEVRRREAQKQKEPKKPDIIDKTIEKAADYFGVKEYSQLASNFLKDQAKNLAIDQVKGLANKGVTYIKGTKVLGTILSLPAKILGKPIAKAANVAANAMDPANVVKNGAKFVGKTAKAVAWDAPKMLHKGVKWLENGGYKKLKNIAQTISNGTKFVAKYAGMASNFLSKVTAAGSRLASLGIGQGSKVAKVGAQYLQKGATALVNLLKKVR